jgi:hypothetical protein
MEEIVRKCECMETAKLPKDMELWYDEKTELPFVNHNPDECKCTNKLKQYIRNGKKVWLCSCCSSWQDLEVR